MPLLDIRNLALDIPSPSGLIRAVDKVSLTIKAGEFRALVGESGSGKSLIAKAIMGALGEKWQLSADRFYWRDHDLMRLPPEKRKAVIQQDVAMIFQEPASCLDPTATLREQLEEAIPSSRLQGSFWKRRQQRRQQVIALLHKVGIKQHQTILDSYPYQLSDGLCQKVMIAMALAKSPKLLIADEPTTAMEVLTQLQIFRLLAKLNTGKGMAILLISHDLQLIHEWAQSVTVLYCGQAVESGLCRHVFSQPRHPYTHALINCSLYFNHRIAPRQLLPTLPGSIPPLQHLPVGCRLGPRCPNARRECVQAPRMRKIERQQVSCHFPLTPEDNHDPAA